MSKSLVVYFSATGVTANAAKEVAKMSDADLYEIKPAIPYTHADLDWTDKNSRTTREMQDDSFRPEILNMDLNIDEYDTIFLGFPIWWYVAPAIINTFLEGYKFTGKIIRPFFTSGGSGAGDTDERLHKSAPDAAWRPAKRLHPEDKADIKNWVSDSY